MSDAPDETGPDDEGGGFDPGGAKTPRSKHEIRIPCDDRLLQDFKLFCAYSGRKTTEVGQTALRDYLADQQMRKTAETIKNMPAGTDEERQARYIAALEENYYPNLAARMAGVSLDEVIGWEHDDEEFAQKAEEAAALFIAQFEMKIILDIKAGKKVNKDAFTFWVAFQNAHNDQYGRMKAEMIARDYADFADLVYKIIDGEFTPEQAKGVKDKVKEAASKRLSKMS